MAVVGIDLGTYQSVIAVARNRGIDIVTNEISNRFTPSMVGFQGNSRLLGEAAKTQEVMNSKNTVANLKRLIGRDFAEPEIQEVEKRFVTCELVADKDGGIATNVNYQDEQKQFSIAQLYGMYLTNLKHIAEMNLQTNVSDVVLSVPAYYTDRQRHALTNAAQIAGLNVLRLVNEPAAVALQYGITRARELPEKDQTPRHVVFVDMGHSALTVSVCAFTQEKGTMRSTVFDRNFGGRNLDYALQKHFVEEIKAKHKVDITTKPKAMLRLRIALERLKKVLSANLLAPLNIECLTDEIDLNSQLTREDLEKFIADELPSIERTLQAALDQAGLSKDNIDFVELLGGSVRVPAVKARINAFFGNKEHLLSTTLNPEEACARGCAFQAAMISPLFKVRDYAVRDVTPFDINLSWKSATGDSIITERIFSCGDALPSTKQLTFGHTEPFEVVATYATPAQLPAGTRTDVARFTIQGVKPNKDGRPNEIKIRVRMNPSGILTIESAHMVEETDEEKMEVDSKADAEEKKENENEAPAADAVEGDKKEEKKKRKVRKIDLHVHSVTASVPEGFLSVLREAETKMIASDKLIADTLEKKNSLEEYVYDMRSKLEGSHANFVLPDEREKFLAKLAETENWLYDEGENATKSVFVERLDALKKIGNPIIERHAEAEARPRAEQELRATLAEFRALATSKDEKYSHIPEEERQKILAEADKKEQLLNELLAKQAALKPHENIAFKASQLQAERESFTFFARAIMNKPKPKETAPAPNGPPKQEPEPENPRDKMDTDQPEITPSQEQVAPTHPPQDMEVD